MKSLYWKRVLLKLSGEALMGENDFGICPDILNSVSNEIKDVVNTNNLTISFHRGPDNKLTIISAIDNLVKGAAGQAVQNMNVMLGFNETEALK